jgi:hypothetical protein
VELMAPKPSLPEGRVMILVTTTTPLAKTRQGAIGLHLVAGVVQQATITILCVQIVACEDGGLLN